MEDLTKSAEKRVETPAPLLQEESLDRKVSVNGKVGNNAGKVPEAFGSGTSDLQIVSQADQIAAITEHYRKQLNPEQLARAEKAADVYRYIQGPGKDGKFPEVSDYVKSQKPIPMDKQADVKRWIIEAAKIDERNGVIAKPGDTYWGVAHGEISKREGREARGGEVKAMVKEMAILNGKTEAETGTLRVGEAIKLPPPKRKTV